MKKVFPFLFIILSCSLIAQENPTIADFTTAIRLDPDDADAYLGRGNAYYGLGDYNTATILDSSVSPKYSNLSLLESEDLDLCVSACL